MIYLDNCATTEPDEAVIARMNEIERTCYFNPHAFYRPAMRAEALVRESADTLARMTLGADARVIFTSGGTESDNLAILGSVGNRRGHVLTTAGEHPAVYEVFRHMEQSGRSVGYAPLGRDGAVDVGALIGMLQPDTILVSVMSVSNETGAVNDLSAVKKAMRAVCPEALLHTDAVQAFGHIDACTDVDMY
ncbi:MAG: aminotransferase class V-fold PLP-dependent enzyme, partial [Eubacteriales bacterium]|nr:aminotransferase class V-fold PLP-dependent enzyme [Eubacteriales bacterium]